MKQKTKSINPDFSEVLQKHKRQQAKNTEQIQFSGKQCGT